MEPGHEGPGGDTDPYTSYGAELKAMRKEVKEVKRALTDLKAQVEGESFRFLLGDLALLDRAFDFSIHDIEDGKKISVLKKNLGMTKYLYAWTKKAEEKMPELKMEEKGNGWKK